MFGGEQFDENLGDYYLRQRYYDADLGRFTRRDTYEGTLFEPVTLHKYLFAKSNPANFIDPTGYFSILSQTAAVSVLTALAVELGRSVIAPLPVQAPQESGDTSDPLAGQRNLYDLATLVGGIGAASLGGFKLVTQGGKQFLAYLAGEVGYEGTQYLSPVGAAVRGQFFPKGAWIARDTFQRLVREAGNQNRSKFIAALQKSIERGTVGPVNEAGIKVLAAPVRGYTHELKINGSAARILGKFDENGVLVFDDYLPKGLH